MLLRAIYEDLWGLYGPQGWWPVRSEHSQNRGYHPGEYVVPRTRRGRFEVCVGAILTQNTAWSNVEKAIDNLCQADLLEPESVAAISVQELAEMIRPAGYFRQKSRYLQEMAQWFCALRGKPERKDILSLKGVGPETADSILLYAFGQPTFVVDAYTRRIFSAWGLIQPAADYETIRSFFMQNLPEDVPLFQEYHALIVEHAKRYYRKGFNTSQCPLSPKFSFRCNNTYDADALVENFHRF